MIESYRSCVVWGLLRRQRHLRKRVKETREVLRTAGWKAADARRLQVSRAPLRVGCPICPEGETHDQGRHRH